MCPLPSRYARKRLRREEREREYEAEMEKAREARDEIVQLIKFDLDAGRPLEEILTDIVLGEYGK